MAECCKCTNEFDCPFAIQKDIICSSFDPKPVTNADRIRAMSDEELAKWLEVEFLKCPWCKEDAPVDPVTKECLVPHQFCWECTLDWLKSPAEVEE
jgi:hypothetical protein